MTDTGPTVGEKWYGKEVLELKSLSEKGWKIYRVDGDKSEDDFIVKVINPDHPRGIKIKYAHFAIDFFGKLMQDRDAALMLFDGLIETWHGAEIKTILEQISDEISHLNGYALDFILYAMDWILEQEDINYTSGERGPEKQREINNISSEMGVTPPPGREGSQLPISLFSNIANDKHPVEALYRVGIDVRSVR